MERSPKHFALLLVVAEYLDTRSTRNKSFGCIVGQFVKLPHAHGFDVENAKRGKLQNTRSQGSNQRQVYCCIALFCLLSHANACLSYGVDGLCATLIWALHIRASHSRKYLSRERKITSHVQVPDTYTVFGGSCTVLPIKSKLDTSQGPFSSFLIESVIEP